MKNLILVLIAVGLTACEYSESTYDVFVEVSAPQYKNSEVKLCAKVNYIDASLTDSGYEFRSFVLCKKMQIDNQGVAAVRFEGSVNDLAADAILRRQSRNLGSNIEGVDCFLKTQSGIELPKSTDSSHVYISPYSGDLRGTVRVQF